MQRFLCYERLPSQKLKYPNLVINETNFRIKIKQIMTNFSLNKILLCKPLNEYLLSFNNDSFATKSDILS